MTGGTSGADDAIERFGIDFGEGLNGGRLPASLSSCVPLCPLEYASPRMLLLKPARSSRASGHSIMRSEIFSRPHNRALVARQVLVSLLHAISIPT